VFSAERASLLH